MTRSNLLRLPVFLLCLFGVTGVAGAQTVTDQRVWATLIMQGRVGKASPWRWGLESYVRSRNGVDVLDVAAVRPLIFYDITKHASVAAGYAFAPSFPASDGKTVEHRVFQQYLWTGPAAGGSLTLRTRLEERFIEGNSGVLVRLRQQLRFSHPIRSGSRTAIVGYDELFMHLNTTTRSPRGIDQNRVFGGISETLTAKVRFEIGYLNQFSPGHGGAADKMNHVLSGTLILTF